MIKLLQHRVYTIISFLTLLIVWFLASEFELLGNTLLASPKEVLNTILYAFDKSAISEDKFYIHAFYTIKLALIGWGLAMFWGILFGIILGNTRVFLKITEPSIDFLRSIPPILVFPLFLVAFNYSIDAYIWTIFFGTFPVTTITVANGFKYISKDSIKILNVHKVSVFIQSLIKFVEIMPSIITGARLSLSLSIIIAIVSEMVFTPRSGWALGALARDAELSFDTPLFYTCVITIGFFGYIMNLLLIKLENFFKTI